VTNAQQWPVRSVLLLEQHFDYSLIAIGMKEKDGLHIQSDEEFAGLELGNGE